MAWLLINADNTLASGPHETSPACETGQRREEVPVGYGTASEWSPNHGGGFIDIVPKPLPPAFLALLTELAEAGGLTPEAIARIRAAA